MHRVGIYRKMIKTVLIDLSGTLHVEDEVVPGAIEALKKLRKTQVKIKFVTNTTKESQNCLYQRLVKLGFDIKKDEIFSSLTAARELIIKNNLRPMFFLSSSAMEDFEEFRLEENEEPNAVVIGLAPEEFHYEKLNEAFRCILEGAKFIAIHEARYYKRKDGLALGPGPFIKGLEYATQCKAEVVGKPNKSFFLSAVSENILPSEVAMIGDDVNDDVLGAIVCGMQGYLVQTGKYRPYDEKKIHPRPSAVCKDFTEAVNLLINNIHK